MKIDGSVKLLGDNINTDYIISSHRKRNTTDLHELKKYIFEDIEKGFYENLPQQSILAAGKNFGCGSAMEVAVLVLKAAGIRLILARSFARSYYRNGINNGLFLIEMDTSLFRSGEQIEAFLYKEKSFLKRIGKDEVLSLKSPDALAFDIHKAGSLIDYVNQNSMET